MKTFLGGVIAGICLLVLSALLFVQLGGMPVATSGGSLPFERTIAGMAIHAALRGHEDEPSPLAASEENLLAGAKIYADNCAICHGLPARSPSPIAKGLFPSPPQLFNQDQMVTDDPVGEIFWKAKNGIRLTGMPGFEGSRSDQELWQVSLLLNKADHVSNEVKTVLTR